MTRYLTVQQVLFIHARLIQATGGEHGVRDLGLLQSAVFRPQATFDGVELYGGLFDKAAALMISLAQNHPFVDGNKRTAITAAGLFLRQNGWQLATSSEELEEFALRVVNEGLDVKACAKWLIAALSRETCDEWLLRLAQREEPHLSLAFQRSLEPERQSEPGAQQRRTVGELLSLAEAEHEQRRQRAAAEAEARRFRELEALAPKAEDTWTFVQQLLEQGYGHYDEVVELLVRLHELAIHQGMAEEFTARVQEIRTTYATRKTLLQRMDRAGLP